MSEYQYYEFRALDRPLTDKEQAELRALSTRAEITPYSFTNEYHWGDFKGNPEVLMEKYFDAFFYVANWGTRQLMLRLPRDLVDLDAMRPYVIGDGCDMKLHKDSVVIEWRSDDEGGSDYDEKWDGGAGGLDRLLALRDELLAGDLRPLYIGFLNAVEMGGEYGAEIDPDTPEPPLPPGLRKLTRAQKELADFLRLSTDLLEAAVEGAPEGGPPAGPTEEEMAAWLAALPPADKDAVLLRILAGDLAEAGRELQGRFRQAWRAGRRAAPPEAEESRRTVGRLLEAGEEMADVLKRRAAEERERERRRREQEKIRARDKRLAAMQGRDGEFLRKAEDLLAGRQRSTYPEVTEILSDLHALAEREGRAAEFLDRLRSFRDRHATKKALMDKLDAAGLPR
jgi:hypothetical protein